MARLLLLLAALLFSNTAFAQSRTFPCHTSNGDNCIREYAASNSAAISTASASTVQLVALTSGQSIFVTSWDVMSAGTTNVTLVYGTGTNCGTGTTSLTGAYPLIAQAGISKGIGLGAILFVPPGNALCVTNSAAIQISGSISYVKY
jgi:hypothetical protein